MAGCSNRRRASWPIHYTHRQRSVINIPIIVYAAPHQMAANENLLMSPTHGARYTTYDTHPLTSSWRLSCNWRSSFSYVFKPQNGEEALCRHKYSWSTKRVLVRMLRSSCWGVACEGKWMVSAGNRISVWSIVATRRQRNAICNMLHCKCGVCLILNAPRRACTWIWMSPRLVFSPGDRLWLVGCGGCEFGGRLSKQSRMCALNSGLPPTHSHTHSHSCKHPAK